MIIVVGTKNQIKVQAVEETLQDYSQYANAAIHSIAVPSEVSEQPLSLEEIIKGAKNRAKKAFETWNPCDFSFGIESGLFEAPGTQTGFLEACVCVIYNGNDFFTGLSCGFEVPPHILELVIDKKRDLAQACFESGITTNSKLGSAEGLIGILTKGRVNRKIYTKQCITTALLQLENAEMYSTEKPLPVLMSGPRE